LILPILAAHDRAGFQPVVYSAAPLSDAVIAELHAAGTTGVDASALGDAGLDQRIRGDRIDILIDLSGHTPGSRLWAMARRPAPVQVSYLGYPCTTGLKSIGHRIVDAITDPEGGDDLSTEKLVRLEGCAACYQPPEGEISPPPADRTGHISFASFSPVPRISEQMAELWSRILKAVPGSELTIAAPGADSLWTQEHFREVFGRHGVEGQRLRFQSPGTGWNAAAYHDVDIALDTSPWNGLTSTCDALWMGVPVVSLAADRAAGRVGRSLLTACGQPDLVVSTAGAYVDLAVALAQDSPRRAGLRRSLRETMKRSPILDGAGVTRRLEAVYRSLWRDWCGKVYYTE
jgi:predicted O-linked N-acetylglucosamine transferase (SPINDLY family)